MALPKQVEQQMQEIEEHEKKLQAPVEDEQTDVSEEVSRPVAETVEVAPEPAVAPAVPDDWEHKYRTLEGKYSSEVPRLHQQLKDLTGHVEYLQQQMQTRTEAPSEPEQYVTDQDKEAFGEDLIDLQRRVAREISKSYEKKLESYEAKIVDLENRISRTGGELANMTFEQRLISLVPDFNAVNADPRWVSWLDEVDSFSGDPRRVYAEKVYNSGDAAAVARIVNMFKSQGATAPQAPRQAELQKQVQPSRTSSAGSTGQTERVYTSTEYNRLWDKVRDLSMKGKSDEANKLESEITAAYSQGRVR